MMTITAKQMTPAFYFAFIAGLLTVKNSDQIFNGHDFCPTNPNCYGQYCYHFVARLLNFYNAVQYCKGYNLDLVCIYSQSENEFVAQLIFNEINLRDTISDVWTAGYTPRFNITEFSWKTSSISQESKINWTSDIIPANKLQSEALYQRPAAILFSHSSDFKKWTYDTTYRRASAVCKTKFPIMTTTKCPNICNGPPFGPPNNPLFTVPPVECGPTGFQPKTTQGSSSTSDNSTIQPTPPTTDPVPTTPDTNITEGVLTNSTTEDDTTTTHQTTEDVTTTTHQTTEDDTTTTHQTTEDDTTTTHQTTEYVTTTTDVTTDFVTESTTVDIVSPTLHEEHCGPNEEAGITWPQTPIGTAAVQPCPPGSTGNATWFCDARSGTFQPPHSPYLADCKHDGIMEIEQEVTNGDYAVMTVTWALEAQVLSTEHLYGADLISVQYILQDVITKAENDYHHLFNEDNVANFTGCVVTICGQVLQDTHLPAWLSIQRVDRVTTANLLTENIDKVGFLDLQHRHNYSNIFNNVNIELTVDIIDVQSPHVYNISRFGAAVYFPPENIEDENLRIVIAVYNNLQMLLIGDNRTEKLAANSHVIGVSVGEPGNQVKFPKDGIQLYFSTLNPAIPGYPVCAYWAFSRDGGRWDHQGCQIKEQGDNGVVCSCDHLTNFAVLMDFHGALETANPKALAALRYLTIIGCSLSIACLIANIAIFQFVRSIQSVRSTITKNICLCLLLANTTLLAGLESTQNQVLCAVVAAVLLYEYLATFMWMLMAGIHLHRLLHRVFENTRRIEYYLAGYGAPLVIVTLTAAIYPEDFGTEDYCWLDTKGNAMWFFAIPISAIIATNVVFLGFALRASHKVHKLVNPGKKRQYLKQCFRGSFHLTSILGITWMFGYFIGDTNLAFAFIFTIINSTQGMMIFISQCIFNGQTRKATVAAIARLYQRSRCHKFVIKQGCAEKGCGEKGCKTVQRVQSAGGQSVQILTTPVSTPRGSTDENILPLPNVHIISNHM